MDAKRVKEFTAVLAISDEDLLSNLFDDCLLSVLSYVDRITLDVMKTVSQKMNNFARKNMFRNIKTQAQELVISEDEYGLKFYLNLLHESTCLAYTIEIDEEWIDNGWRNKKNSTRERLNKHYNGHITLRFLGLGDFLPTPLPLEMYDNLRILCDKYCFSSLTLHNVYIDKYLMNFCESSGKLNLLTDIELSDISVAPNLDADEILRTVLATKAQSLRFFDDSDRIFSDKLGENFFRNFCSHTPGISYSFSKTNFDYALWNASSDFLPIICRFNNFSNIHLLISSDLVLELIMMRFRMSFDDVSWELTDSITEQQLLAKIEAKGQDLEVVCINLTEDGETRLRKRNTDFACRFTENVFQDINIEFSPTNFTETRTYIEL